MSDGYTIGEVLNQLKEDFEDITISKIRFLESEGLVHPDRTESGYRKFTDDDVDRLRFILTAQRDHYLPLRVIREQLERLDAGELPPTKPLPTPPGASHGEADGAVADGESGVGGASGAAGVTGADLEAPPGGGSMGVRELAEASGLDAAQIRSLRDYGVLGNRGDEKTPFDTDDLAAARAAKELLRLGLEPRHLRMYRQFVEREMSLFEQLVAPMMRQRNPEARRQATQQLETLSSLTTRLQSALLARALRSHLHGS